MAALVSYGLTEEEEIGMVEALDHE